MYNRGNALYSKIYIYFIFEYIITKCLLINKENQGDYSVKKTQI